MNKVLGFDLGTRTLGIAKSDVMGIAHGYEEFRFLVGERARSAERFKASLLELDPSLKITLVDERLTTVMATRRLLEADLSRAKRHKVIDQQAAIVILESYLAQKENQDGDQ